MQEYGFDIGEAHFFADEDMTIEIEMEAIPEETLKKILGGIPIIRCKDCADWQTDWIPSCGDNGSHYCGAMDTITKPDDYCSYAERRTDE